LAGTLPRGGTLPRVTDNAMCHIKILTGGKFKKKKSEADTWHAVNSVCEKLTGCTTLRTCVLIYWGWSRTWVV